MITRFVCWDTVSAPGPKIDRVLRTDFLPREGEQLEFDGVDLPGIPDGTYYVHKVRHVYDSVSGLEPVIELTTRHPGAGSASHRRERVGEDF